MSEPLEQLVVVGMQGGERGRLTLLVGRWLREVDVMVMTPCGRGCQ